MGSKKEKYFFYYLKANHSFIDKEYDLHFIFNSTVQITIPTRDFNRITRILSHFMPLVSIHPLRKHKKASTYLMFSGGIERDH